MCADVIIVEASGVARPDHMATLLLGASGVAPAQIVTVVDMSQARAALENKYICELFSHQITVAQCLAPNHMCPDNAQVLKRLSAPDGITPPHVTGLGQVVQGAVLPQTTARRSQSATPLVQMQSDLDSAQFVRKLVSVPDGADIEQVHDWLANMPQHIHRAKGFAQLSDQHGRMALYTLSKSRNVVRVQPSTANIPKDVVGQVVVIAPRAAPGAQLCDWDVSFGGVGG